jgi:hypothetical protein
MLVTAPVVGAGAALVSDDSEAMGVCLAAGILLLARGVQYAGTPFGATGRPPSAKLAVLYAAGILALGLEALVHPILCIAALEASYGIVVLSLRRWPPSEWLQRTDEDRAGQRAPGLACAIGGTFVGWFALLGVIVAVSDSRVVQVPLGILLTVLAIAVWIRIAWSYVPKPDSQPR